MKQIKFILVGLLVLLSFDLRAQVQLREATAAEAAAATAGLPAVMTPRRTAALERAAGVVMNGSSNLTFINLGVGLAPQRFGALGDGDILTNVTMTSGSATLAITGGGMKFGRAINSSDIGKKILVYGAGFVTSGVTNCLSTIITAVASGSSITLGTNALNSCSGAKTFAVWGTDDTTALQAWLNYTTNYFSDASTNDMILDVPSGIYVIAGSIVDPWTGTNWVLHKNSQLYLPDYPIVGAFTKTLKIRGHIKPAAHEYAAGPSAFGSIFWSFYVSTNVQPFVGDPRLRLVNQPAILTCQNWTAPVFTGSGNNFFTNRFNPIRVSLENLTFRTGVNPSISGVDLSGTVNCDVKAVFIDTGVYESDGGPCINTNVFGLKLPPTFCDNNSTVDEVNIDNFYTGIELGEHAHIASAGVFGCQIGLMCRNGGHWCIIDNYDAEMVKNLFYNPGSSFGIVANVTTEGAGPGVTWFSPATIINDWNDSFYGSIQIEDTSGVWGANSTNVTAKIGGTHVVLTRHSLTGPTVYGNQTLVGNLSVTTNVTAQTITSTNSDANGIGIAAAVLAESGAAAIGLSTGYGTSGYVKLIKLQQAGNSTYDNAVGLFIQDTLGGRYLWQAGSNGITHFIKGISGGTDVNDSVPVIAVNGLVVGTGKNISQQSTGNNILRLADNSNAILNPPAAGGTLYLNLDQGTGGIVFGNGAGGVSGGVTAAGVGTFNSGITLTATNVLTVTAGGITNNTADTYIFTATVGTGLSLKDGNGTVITTPILNEPIVLKPNWRFTGTTVTASPGLIISR